MVVPMTPKQIRTKPFLTERRGGYCKEEVEDFLDQVADEIQWLQEQLAAATAGRELPALGAGLQRSDEAEQLRDEVRRLRQERDELARRPSEGTDWTAAVGAEVANVLRTTATVADELQQRAERQAATLTADAEEARAAAVAAAAKLRAEAEMHAAEVIAEAWRRGADLVTQQMDRFDELLSAEHGTGPRTEDGHRQLMPASRGS